MSQVAKLVNDLKERENEIDPRPKLEILNQILALYTKEATKIAVTPFLSCLRKSMTHPTSTIRAATLRVLRFYLSASPRPQEFIQQLFQFHYAPFIARSMEQEPEPTVLRLEALRLVRLIMELDSSLLPRSIVQTIHAIADHRKDPYSRVCLETLVDLSLRNPQVVALTNGIKALIQATVNPIYQDIQDSLILALLYLFDHPDTRSYIRPQSDARLLFSALTNLGMTSQPLDTEGFEVRDYWEACLEAISTMLKTWTGVIFLSADPLALKSLVDALSLPNPELNEIILDYLFPIFRIEVPRDVLHYFSSHRFPKRYRTQTEAAVGGTLGSIGGEAGMGLGGELGWSTNQTLLPSRTYGQRPNLMENYTAALLMLFVDLGLIEALVSFGKKLEENSPPEGDPGKVIAIKATILLGELLHMSNTLLPAKQCARLQTLPSLVSHAVSFTVHPRLRCRASAMVANLHQISHNKRSASLYDSYLVTGANKWRRLKGSDRRLDRIDDVKRKFDLKMDEAQLQYKLRQTQVLMTKDHTKWQWDLIAEVLEGPLRSKDHLSITLRTKFIKRLLSFLSPSNRAFATLHWTVENMKYVRVACLVLEVLTQQEEGVVFLRENKFIKQLEELLRVEVEAVADRHVRANTRLLTPERVLKSMSREYFTMLGTLSSNSPGVQLIKDTTILKNIGKMVEMQGREDLSFLILMSLDYNMSEGARVLLQKSLSSNSKVVRYLATRHLRVLMRTGVADFSAWGIESLVRQLQDSNKKVWDLALEILDEACDDIQCLSSLIAKKPPLLALGESGKSLMLRFLSCEAGFAALSESNFIESEMELWQTSGNVAYTLALEQKLDEAFSSSMISSSKEQRKDVVNIPPHFYGELAKTEKGRILLEKSGRVPEMIRQLKDDKVPPLQRRAVLWAMGNIGSSEGGLTFLEKENLLEYIVQLAERSDSLSIRGTCFYVLGMISRTEAGRQQLEELGWETCPQKPHICVPRDLSSNNIFKIARYRYDGSWASASPVLNISKMLPKEQVEALQPDKVVTDILGWLGDLSSFFLAEKARVNLLKTKAKHPEKFNLPAIATVMIQMLACYKYRLPVRRFIYDLMGPSCCDSAFLHLLYSLQPM
ncbi:Cytosolic regulator of adenylyl cyclase [Balamuthia mandrillaris]